MVGAGAVLEAIGTAAAGSATGAAIGTGLGAGAAGGAAGRVTGLTAQPASHTLPTMMIANYSPFMKICNKYISFICFFLYVQSF
jgi:hypothetical protein